MTLDPARYIRFRDLAVGHRCATDEVPCGVNGEWFSACHYRTTLTASHALSSGTGSLLPAFPGGTRFNPAGNNQCFPVSDYTGADGAAAALTSNYYATKRSAPSVKNSTVNFWYRNNSSPGAVNQRMFCIPIGESLNNGYTPLIPMVSMFTWGGADDMLLEMLYGKRNRVLGTAYYSPMPNNETYRYFSAPSSNTLGTVHMFTLRMGLNSMTAFRDGVKYADFTWDENAYQMMKPYVNSAVIGSGGTNSPGAMLQGYGNVDYCTSDISEFSWHDRMLTDAEVVEIYRLGTTGQLSRKFVGTVTDGVGAPLSGRLIRAHKASNGDVLGEGTSLIDGTFTVYASGAFSGAAYILAFDDLGIAPDYNAAIQSNIISVST